MKIFLICQLCQQHCWCTLKGQCHEIFCLRFFSWIIFPQAPENNTSVISNFFENSRRYLPVLLNQRYQWQPTTIATGVNDSSIRFTTGINDIGGKFATGGNNTGNNFDTCVMCQQHRRQIANGINDTGGKLPLVSMTPAANWPPVSMTLVANNGNNIRLLTSKSEL